MPRTLEPGIDDAVPNPRLFHGLKLWFSQNVPQRAWYVKNASDYGAVVVSLDKQADIRLIDHLKKNPPPGCHSYRFIEQSIERGQLEDLDAHAVGESRRADRNVGSVTMASKGSRTSYTEADDQYLWNWVAPYMEKGGYWKGNEIYKQLEAENPRHTWQSWRDRYVKKVQYRNRTVGDGDLTRDAAEPEASEAQLELEALTEGNSHVDKKRKSREDELGGAAVSPNTQRGKLSKDQSKRRRTSPARDRQPASVMEGPSPISMQTPAREEEQTAEEHSGRASDTGSSDTGFVDEILLPRGFTRKEARSLYRAVPYIVTANKEKIQERWLELAEYWRTHQAEEWRYFYDFVMLPQYMRRHGLKNDRELHEYCLHRVSEKNSTSGNDSTIGSVEQTVKLPAEMQSAAYKPQHDPDATLVEETTSSQPSRTPPASATPQRGHQCSPTCYRAEDRSPQCHTCLGRESHAWRWRHQRAYCDACSWCFRTNGFMRPSSNWGLPPEELDNANQIEDDEMTDQCGPLGAREQDLKPEPVSLAQQPSQISPSVVGPRSPSGKDNRDSKPNESRRLASQITDHNSQMQSSKRSIQNGQGCQQTVSKTSSAEQQSNVGGIMSPSPANRGDEEVVEQEGTSQEFSIAHALSRPRLRPSLVKSLLPESQSQSQSQEIPESAQRPHTDATASQDPTTNESAAIQMPTTELMLSISDPRLETLAFNLPTSSYDILRESSPPPSVHLVDDDSERQSQGVSKESSTSSSEMDDDDDDGDDEDGISQEIAQELTPVWKTAPQGNYQSSSMPGSDATDPSSDPIDRDVEAAKGFHCTSDKQDGEIDERGRVDGTNDDEAEDDESDLQTGRGRSAMADPDEEFETAREQQREDTQALFQDSIDDANDVSAFDLPCPEGGWSESDVDEEEQTEADNLRRHPDSASLHSCEDEDEDEVEDEIEIDEDDDTITAISQMPLRGGGELQGISIASEDEDEEQGLEKEKAATEASSDDLELDNWFLEQTGANPSLDSSTTFSLASTAVEATTMNVSLATEVLKYMIRALNRDRRRREAAIAQALSPISSNRRATLYAEFESELDDASYLQVLLPSEMRGCWTSKDDKMITSTNRENRRKMAGKHGEDNAQLRLAFLQQRDAADQEG